MCHNSFLEVFSLLRHQILVALNVNAFSIADFSLPELADQLHQALGKSHYQVLQSGNQRIHWIHHGENLVVTEMVAEAKILVEKHSADVLFHFHLRNIHICRDRHHLWSTYHCELYRLLEEPLAEVRWNLFGGKLICAFLRWRGRWEVIVKLSWGCCCDVVWCCCDVVVQGCLMLCWEMAGHLHIVSCMHVVVVMLFDLVWCCCNKIVVVFDVVVKECVERWLVTFTSSAACIIKTGHSTFGSQCEDLKIAVN